MERIYSRYLKTDFSENVFEPLNRPILAHTGTSQFVTLCYGRLDPGSRDSCYSIAGHLLPLLLRRSSPAHLPELTRTGIPLGVYEDHNWGQSALVVEPGELPVLYAAGTTH